MYPVNLNLTAKPVVVIGGGRIAARKVVGLLAAGATVTVVSPHLDAAIDRTAVCWRPGRYRKADLAHQLLVFACTNDPAVNRQVCQDAAPWQWVNNVGDKAQSDLYNVAVVTAAPLIATVSTDGRDPALTRRVKQDLTKWLAKEQEDVCDRSES